MCQSHLLIGAASSGSGKTTFTLGLLRALKNRSFKVQPFKCGPDYIDTRHHRMAAGNPSVNLDLFMMSEAHVRDLYAGYTEKADVAVTEGMMGLFDGYDGMKGSCAEICLYAENTGSPDCKRKVRHIRWLLYCTDLNNSTSKCR